MVESKRKIIEKLLSEGKSPEDIAKEAGCTVRYAYEIKALNEQPKSEEPTVKNHLVGIEDTLKKLSGDINIIRKVEQDPIIVCPCCKDMTTLSSAEICGECGVMLCTDCIENHKQPDTASTWNPFEDKSLCQKYQEQTQPAIQKKEDKREKN
ncbi:MAG: helix-turn-helix domain-containing protein [Candidatus Methanoperedens sp.]|nr:helix-turn-helix domain-containing protein [Candidatus Methanoperedens sp.]